MVKSCMRLCMTCSSRRSARQAHARVRSLATNPTPSVTSLKVLPAHKQSAEFLIIAASFVQYLVTIEVEHQKGENGQDHYNLSFIIMTFLFLLHNMMLVVMLSYAWQHLPCMVSPITLC
jgi:hypothetical protein